MRAGCCSSQIRCGNCGAPAGIHGYVHPHTRGEECAGFVPKKARQPVKVAGNAP